MIIKNNIIKKIILVLLILFSLTTTFNVSAVVLTPSDKVTEQNFNWVYDGQQYFDVNAKQIDFNQGLPKDCDKNLSKKECKNFQWVIFTTKPEFVKENKEGYKNIYSEKIYSTIEEAKNDKQMILVLENSKKRINIEEKIKKEIENMTKNKSAFLVNMLIVFLFVVLIFGAIILYFWTHKSIVNQIEQESKQKQIKLEIFEPTKK